MLTPTFCLGDVEAMPIKSKSAQLIYQGCLLCQAIDELEVHIKTIPECQKILSDSYFKKILKHKDQWLNALSMEDKSGEA